MDKTKKYKFTLEGVNGYVIMKPTKTSGYVNVEAYHNGKLIKSAKNVKIQIADMKESDYED